MAKKKKKKEFYNEKKFLGPKIPLPPPHNFSNRPSLIKRNFRQAKVLHVLGYSCSLTSDRNRES